MSNFKTVMKRYGKRLTPRQWRLFACACVRRVTETTRGSNGAAIDLAERFADGQATTHQLASSRFAGRFQSGNAAWAVCWDPAEDARGMAERASAWAAGLLGEVHGTNLPRRERTIDFELFHEIANHLIEPAHIDPLWLAWNDGTVRQLAETIYDERSWDQMPILGDALEDAGCQDERILGHCRRGGPHVRGCWLLDLILPLVTDTPRAPARRHRAPRPPRPARRPCGRPRRGCGTGRPLRGSSPRRRS